MATELGALTPLELGVAVYEELLAKHPYREVEFGDNPPTAVAEDDNDIHGGMGRVGYIYYDRVSLLQYGDKTLALALGTRSRNYPADKYAFDLKAFPIDVRGKNEQDLAGELREVVGRKPFFNSSLLVGLVGQGILAGQVGLEGALRPRFKEYIAQEPKLNNKVLNLAGLGPPMLEQGIKFKPEFVGVVAEAIFILLSNI